MPSHQTFKFLYNFKAKRYNVNLMNKNQPEPKHFWAFICDEMKKLNMMRSYLITGISDKTQIAVVV